MSEATDDFSFKSWFRAVKWRYSNHPLCTLGSLKDPGGRFNIGNMNPNLIPQFSALYIAQDKETAEKELWSYKSFSKKNYLIFFAAKTRSLNSFFVAISIVSFFNSCAFSDLTNDSSRDQQSVAIVEDR